MVDIDSRSLTRTINTTLRGICLAFGGDASQLWVGGGTAQGVGRIETWDVDSGELIRSARLGPQEALMNIAVSRADNRMLTVDFRGGVKLWDTETGEELRRFVFSGGRGGVPLFSPTKPYFLFGSYRHPAGAEPYGYLTVWDASNRFEVVQSFKFPGFAFQKAGFSDDGSKVFGLSSNGQSVQWDRSGDSQTITSAAGNADGIRHAHGGLIAMPFEDRVRVIDLSYRDSPHARMVDQQNKQRRLRHHRREASRRRRGATDMSRTTSIAWMIENVEESDSLRAHRLSELARAVKSARDAYASRYEDDPNNDLNQLLPVIVRGAIDAHALEDPKWTQASESIEPSHQDQIPTLESALAVRWEIEQEIDKASKHVGQKEYEQARDIYQSVLERMQERSNDPFETIAQVGLGNTSPLSIVSLMHELATMEKMAGRPKVRQEVLEELAQIIERGMRVDTWRDWLELATVQIEINDPRATESYSKYLQLAGKADLIPATGEYSPYMNAEELTAIFRMMNSKKQMPVSIEGRKVNEVSEYRIKFQKIEETCYYYFHFGVSETGFAALSQKYQKDGFSMVDEDRFIGPSDKPIHSGIWKKLAP